MSAESRTCRRFSLAGPSHEWAILALAVGGFNFALMPCIGGLYDWSAVPVGLAGLVLAWYALLRARGPARGRPVEHRPGRTVICVSAVVNTLFVLKIALDILWTGHEPLLG